MFLSTYIKLILVQLLALISIWPSLNDCLIITSVLAGDKKFKTISFDTKFLKPLTFEKEMPLTEFRRHRTIRPPKFDIDVNIPIKLPLEDEYAQEEYKKPVVNNIFFQSGEIEEPNYNKRKPIYIEKKPKFYPKKTVYKDEMYSASSQKQKHQQITAPLASEQIQPQHPEFDDAKVSRRASTMLSETIKQKQLPHINQQQHQTSLYQNYQNVDYKSNDGIIARSDIKDTQFAENKQQQLSEPLNVDSSRNSYTPYKGSAYQSTYNQNYQQPPEFIPGGYVNLQLSGPTGGPQMTYEDLDREKWAQQLSQTPGAMPFPILNYHQLQNFYGGLGTFTNGLADNRYGPDSILEKLKSCFHHMMSKLHIG